MKDYSNALEQARDIYVKKCRIPRASNLLHVLETVKRKIQLRVSDSYIFVPKDNSVPTRLST